MKLCRRSASTNRMTLARDCEAGATASAAVVEGIVDEEEEEEEDLTGDVLLRLFERDEAIEEEAGACDM